jgi:hypothetical protein
LHVKEPAHACPFTRGWRRYLGGYRRGSRLGGSHSRRIS